MALLSQITLDEVWFCEVDADPKTNGIAAPVGSFAMQKGTGRCWQKYDVADTAWLDVQCTSFQITQTNSVALTGSNQDQAITSFVVTPDIPGTYAAFATVNTIYSVANATISWALSKNGTAVEDTRRGIRSSGAGGAPVGMATNGNLSCNGTTDAIGAVVKAATAGASWTITGRTLQLIRTGP